MAIKSPRLTKPAVKKAPKFQKNLKSPTSKSTELDLNYLKNSKKQVILERERSEVKIL